MSPTPSVRSRDNDFIIVFPPITRRVFEKPASNFADEERYVWRGKQYTVSEGHRKTNGRYYEGGPFFTYRQHANIPTRHVDLKGEFGVNEFKYSGPICMPYIPSEYGGHSAPSEDSKHLNPVGAEAIAAVAPTNPNAQTGVALGEVLNDRYIPIPGISAWRRRTEIAKAAAGEYLNAVFGWIPLISDMKDTAQSVLDGNTILENYRSASGSLVHREFAFPDSESDSDGYATLNGWATYHPDANVASFQTGSGVPVTVSRKQSTRRWFSGSFTYHANSGGSSFAECLGIGSDAEKLFGVSLTPDLVWELTPWSWAIDWFSNAQSVVHNVNAFALAGLVMQYGYIMEETSIVDTYSMPATGLSGVTGTVPPATYTTTVKRRVPANPFGFGVEWEGLSPTQLAITAALGITHLR